MSENSPNLPSDRKDIRVDGACKFVDRSFFSKLLVSNRKLTRRDIRQANLRGLFDLVNEEWFVIEEEKLFPTPSS